MRIRKIIFPLLAVMMVAILPSCKLISSVLHDDDVVATAGGKKLFRAELESVIPHGISSEDSLAIATQYINTWAADRVFEQAATGSLSKKDLDLSAELEQYRRVLVRYRYEQQFVNERLDTLVSDSEVKVYYDVHKERYELDFPILKARYVKISPDSPDLAKIKKLMASTSDEDAETLESLVATAAQKYSDFGGGWLDVKALADEFETDYGTLLALMSSSAIQYLADDGTLHYARVMDYMRAGTIPPVEYCAPRIREAIVNARRQAIIVKLEQDLLDKARSNGNFVIY